MKSIAVVLVDWNGIEVTRECLRSLSKINSSGLDKVQVIVVDNGSKNAVEDSLRGDFGGVVYLRSAINRDFAGGNNIFPIFGTMTKHINRTIKLIITIHAHGGIVSLLN